MAKDNLDQLNDWQELFHLTIETNYFSIPKKEDDPQV